MWAFIQTQILGMKWLNILIGALLSALGLDIDSRTGSGIHFFIYDVIKITILLCLLIFVISSPMVDLGSLVLLMSIFGARIAIVYVVMGLMIAVAGGTLIESLHMEDQVADFIRNANSSVDVEIPKGLAKEYIFKRIRHGVKHHFNSGFRRGDVIIKEPFSGHSERAIAI